ENMAEGVSLVDEYGVIRYTNPAEDAMFGYARGELLGQPVTVLHDYSPEENRQMTQEVMAQLRQRGSWAGEFRNRKKDGTAFTTSARITTLEMAGKPYRVCVQQDVTLAKQAEEALRDSQALYYSLVESLPVSLFRKDRQGRFTFGNTRFAL